MHSHRFRQTTTGQPLYNHLDHYLLD